MHNLMVGFEELCGGVLLKELLSLYLEKVGIAHFFISATMLFLDCACFMRFHDISLASFNAFFEQLLAFLGPL